MARTAYFAILLVAAAILSACTETAVWIQAPDPDGAPTDKIALDLRTMSVYDRERKSGPMCPKTGSCGFRHTHKRSLCAETARTHAALTNACAKSLGAASAHCQDLKLAIDRCP